MTGIVQTRSFRWTKTFLPSTEAVVEEACTALWNDVNSFLATLDPVNVLDIQKYMYPVGKYDAMTTYEVIVIYLQP